MAYRSFADFIRRRGRYIRDTNSQKFLDSVLETATKRKHEIKTGAKLWRAQLDHGWREHREQLEDGSEVVMGELPAPASNSRMVPLVDRAKEGRVNPKGIPCLYLATSRETALAEVRPWVGSLVSIGLFVTSRPLALVNCAADLGFRLTEFDLLTDPPTRLTDEEVEGWVWRDINEAFARPVTPSDDRADYAATQVLAEAFRFAEFDGILYASKVGTGLSVACFDINAASLVRCELREVESIAFSSSEVANPCYWQHTQAKHTPQQPVTTEKQEGTQELE